MKKFAAVAVLLLLAVPAAAEVRTFKVCDSKTLAASNANTYGLGNGVTDCTYTDISSCKFFSFQIYCGETTGNDMQIDVDWVGGGAASAAFMGVPVLVTGSAMGALQTNYTTEDAWSTLRSIQPPVSPVGTLRFTNDNADADIVCSANLYCGM